MPFPVRRPWQPGTLWQKLQTQTQYALETGALQPISTEYELIEQDGIPFLVRVLANVSRKEAARRQQSQQEKATGKPINPFLPYDEDLFVTDISDTHLCLLNKYNVVDHHLLIVTRQYESQEDWLSLTDFEALWKCLAEVDGFAFYNAGKIAGASQPHRHLQLVPLPLTPEFSGVPIGVAIAAAQFTHSIGQSPLLPFRHAIGLNPWPAAPAVAAEQGYRRYHQLLKQVGIADPTGSWEGRQSAAYNLLCTRQWMMVIPRRQECYSQISVNSLGFAGSLLAKNAEVLARLKTIGPLTLLQAVAFPNPN
ncbi:phosphorylase [Romeria aff. gracilis LEGE 07310]|uniref:Phosphorylase n=1 Tax=Vasconcelosia minhoensis LEGE 07310 TaxID=915328 RepID=A0A8J7DS31_9CYAN|nr:phosphorylase [Romeria gracilis]MBE9079654.1 phosphorylase [Romeria aff. gracilis LEGE 07310]